MSNKMKISIALGILLAVGGYYVFDSFAGIGAGIFGLIFGQGKPKGMDVLEDREDALEDDLEGLEDELNGDVEDLTLDGEAGHWDD